MFFALFWPCFSPRTLYVVALRMLLRMSLIFQRSFPTPLSSQKCPPTPQINRQYGFFHSAPHSESQPRPPLCFCRTRQLFLTTFDGQLFAPFENGSRIKEFIGRICLDKRFQQRQHGCGMNHIISIISAKNMNKKTHRGLLKPSSSCCRPS